MRKRSLAFVGILLGLGAAGSEAADEKPFTVVQKFMDAFNKGDVAAAAATHSATPDLTIIDEVPPYLWSGEKAFQTWGAALDADSKKNGITDQAVTVSAPTRVEMDGDRAYLVVPAVYTFKQKGVAMREKAQMAITLEKGAGGWLIHGWSWTGPKPQAAAPAAKP